MPLLLLSLSSREFHSWRRCAMRVAASMPSRVGMMVCRRGYYIHRWWE